MAQPAFKLHSSETGTGYSLFASEPSAPGPWRTFLVMDGDMFASGRVDLGPVNQVADNMLLVGVGYGAGFGDPHNRRGRDYTPVAHGDEPTSGGGDAFLRFLSDTLWPELVRRYPVDPRVRGIAGHSIGSLLVLHALFQAEPFFTHFLASAPSIWWADRAILKQAAELRARQSRLPGKLFLSVGEKDTVSMTGDLRQLEKQLAAQPFAGLEITSRIFPGFDHYDVVPVAFATGLAALLSGETDAKL
ncbi:MAG TPA: alpha/beta hydrolase-fold protein [Opitutaceae bacterium]|nr:alpha/beta hydrolase-fold protein [Opitutaceae bacterium]